MSWSNENIIAALRFPPHLMSGDVLYAAMEHYDAIKPDLHHALKLSPDEIERLEKSKDNDYALKIFAMFMAAEKRDSEAFPLILDYFTSYKHKAWNCLGNMSPTDLGRILASVCDADAGALKSAMMLNQPGEFIRLACMDALCVLLNEGEMSRQTLIAWFRIWLCDDTFTQLECGYLVDCCMFLSLREIKEDALTAWKDHRLDSEDYDAEMIADAFSTPEILEENRLQFSRVNDAVSFIVECSNRQYFDLVANMFFPNELSDLSSFLQQQWGIREAGKLSPEFLHGFMFALALTPELILPSEWYPVLFDDETPEFQSSKAADKAHESLVLFYNRLRNEHLEEKLTGPFHQESRIKRAMMPIARAWCKGFSRVIDLRLDYWMPLTKAMIFNDAITTITAFSNDDNANILLKSLGKKQCVEERKWILEECCNKLPYAIDELLQFSRQHSAIDSYTNHDPAHSNKVGRNAPCPCGSGKKFKKCCGAPGRSLQ